MRLTPKYQKMFSGIIEGRRQQGCNDSPQEVEDMILAFFMPVIRAANKDWIDKLVAQAQT